MHNNMVATAPLSNSQLMGEKPVTLCGLTWYAYRQILHALPQSRSARLIYDRGTLEPTFRTSKCSIKVVWDEAEIC